MCVMEVAIAASAASGLLSAAGALQQGRAAKAQGEYQAAVSRNNQQLAEWQAEDSEARGRQEERRHRLQISQLAGRQRATMAGSGLALEGGTPLDLLSDTAQWGELDALTIRSNAARAAWGHRIEASNQGAEAGFQLAAGRSAAQAGITAAGTSLLGSAGTVADMWYRWKPPKRASYPPSTSTRSTISS
ncbi:MAG: hypothetical protein HQL59_09305 [Magnetococcales bacterium]|nr:hypothetical protein [Magnetococcales bacterium]